jgi:hypothetical protein
MHRPDGRPASASDKEGEPEEEKAPLTHREGDAVECTNVDVESDQQRTKHSRYDTDTASAWD